VARRRGEKKSGEKKKSRGSAKQIRHVRIRERLAEQRVLGAARCAPTKVCATIDRAALYPVSIAERDLGFFAGTAAFRRLLLQDFPNVDRRMVLLAVIGKRNARPFQANPI
jgi:hypothetical protein